MIKIQIYLILLITLVAVNFIKNFIIKIFIIILTLIFIDTDSSAAL